MEKTILNKLIKGLDIPENNLDKVKVENINEEVFKITYENQNYFCSKDKEKLKETLVTLLSELKKCPFSDEFIAESAHLDKEYLEFYIQEEIDYLAEQIKTLLEEENFKEINELMKDYIVNFNFHDFKKKKINALDLAKVIKMRVGSFLEKKAHEMETTIKENPLAFLLKFDTIDKIARDLWQNGNYYFLEINKKKMLRSVLALQGFKCIDNIYLYEVKGE
jgi:hypothetical protein